MKKRILAMITAILLPCIAFAGSQESLADLTIEQLIALNASVRSELFTRKAAVDSVRVPPGKYTVGPDIPAGTYRVSFPELTNTSHGQIDVNDQDGEWVTGYVISVNFGATEIGKLELSEDMTVELYGVNAYFSTYTGLFN